MTLNLGDRRRRLVRGLALAGVAAAGYAFGITSDRALAQPAPGTLPPVVPQGGAVRPGVAAQPGTPVQPQGDRRVVAYVYGDQPIYRDELGDFLIARGGHEKLELLVNKRIIEMAAAARGVVVTAVEVQAGLEDDLRGLGISKQDFEKHVLPRYGKTLYEWVEDVIKPRLILTKMCRARVRVEDADIQKTFENRYGERRAAQIICWGKGEQKVALKHWTEARKGDAEFDAVAKTQADPNLAARCGRVEPIGRHPATEDATVVNKLYSLKAGEISEVIEVPAGLMCIKFTGVVPPEAGKVLDDAMKKTLHDELFSKKLDQEVPKCFQELKTAAKPSLLLKSGPTPAEFRDGVKNIVNNANIINPAGGIPPAATPPSAARP